MSRIPRRYAVWSAAVVVVVGIAGLLQAQNAPPQNAPKAQRRFESQVIESFDAKYEGDTPGHIGRHGELGDSAPLVALGDPVFRGQAKVGTVTRVAWGRATGSLEVEFDPEPNTRISVGEQVWLNFGGEAK